METRDESGRKSERGGEEERERGGEGEGGRQWSLEGHMDPWRATEAYEAQHCLQEREIRERGKGGGREKE